MAWQKLDSETLGIAGDNIDNVFSTKKFIMSMFHTIEDTAQITLGRYNADSASVYAQRESLNGGADALTTSISSLDYALASLDTFGIIYTINISGEEKLTITQLVDSLTAGAGTAPRRRESVSKYVPSPDADITEVNLINGDTGNFAIGSNLTSLGTD